VPYITYYVLQIAGINDVTLLQESTSIFPRSSSVLRQQFIAMSNQNFDESSIGDLGTVTGEKISLEIFLQTNITVFFCPLAVEVENLL